MSVKSVLQVNIVIKKVLEYLLETAGTDFIAQKVVRVQHLTLYVLWDTFARIQLLLELENHNSVLKESSL